MQKLNLGLLFFLQNINILVSDPSKTLPPSGMVESKSVGTFSPLQKQDGQKGLFVDRGVGSPQHVESPRTRTFPDELNSQPETKVCWTYCYELVSSIFSLDTNPFLPIGLQCARH